VKELAEKGEARPHYSDSISPTNLSELLQASTGIARSCN